MIMGDERFGRMTKNDELEGTRGGNGDELFIFLGGLRKTTTHLSQGSRSQSGS